MASVYTPLEAGDPYSIDHGGQSCVIGPQGRLRLFVPYDRIARRSGQTICARCCEQPAETSAAPVAIGRSDRSRSAKCPRCQEIPYTG